MKDTESSGNRFDVGVLFQTKKGCYQQAALKSIDKLIYIINQLQRQQSVTGRVLLVVDCLEIQQ